MTSEAARQRANKTSVLDLLTRRGSAGATNAELLEVGGFRYGARIFELRKMGYDIETKRLDGGLYSFVLKPQEVLFR